VPTVADTIPGYESSTWVSAFAPAGTPRAILDRLNAELGKAMKDPDIAAKLSAQTLYPAHRPSEDLDKRLKIDSEMIGKLFRQFNVKLD
jgi:tripartite-type tricarboxylate transporter receptor subunit TctC